MKKILLKSALLAIVFSLSLFKLNAQTNQAVNFESQPSKLGKAYPVPEDLSSIKNFANFKAKRQESLWFDYIDDARVFGETYTYYTGMYMMPDSLATIPFDDGPSHVSVHGGGMMFDPASLFWEVNSNTLEYSRHLRYTIDSVSIPFKYHNFGSTTDSLIISYTAGDRTGGVRWNSGGTSSTVSYAPATNSVINPNKTAVIRLDSTDNTEGFFRTAFASFIAGSLDLAVNVDVTPGNNDPERGNLFGVTVQFMPEIGASTLGQSLTSDDSSNLDPSNLSMFSMLNMQGTGGITVSDESQNHGLILFSSQRYSDNESWFFLPYAPPGSNKLFNYVLFKVSGQNVGINDINDNVSFALKPNPAKQSEVLFADFKIIKPSNVNISITDLQGKVVKNVTNQYYIPGQHNIDVSINDLNTGMYLYNISTEFGSATKKFIIN
ncbi:MAG: T9SS type A sorting domain-containing protein [Bacteroidia bacterium]|nr:T9SS type A sorting domain-containing protein [Bacteroidia bacterium]|tara:strand:+ start:5478 stop:6785 length:1308 start_codon:yes stop_codon:yes gene_type:complete